jgi:hypothetical protein
MTQTAAAAVTMSAAAVTMPRMTQTAAAAITMTQTAAAAVTMPAAAAVTMPQMTQTAAAAVTRPSLNAWDREMRAIIESDYRTDLTGNQRFRACVKHAKARRAAEVAEAHRLQADAGAVEGAGPFGCGRCRRDPAGCLGCSPAKAQRFQAEAGAGAGAGPFG